MARPTKNEALLRSIIDTLADAVAGRLAGRKSGAPAAAKPARKSTAGRKLDMGCRYPGCENRSKGPRFRFLCEQHLKLSKRDQDAALAKA